jgi:methylmalonyl-CoA mutase N-terminal domain/subunit
LARTVDPLAGSYYVESLTDRIEAEARALIEEIDELGGAVKAVETSYYQDAIARSAYELQKAQEDGRVVVVGVNRFESDEPSLPIELPDFAALESCQRERVQAARAKRDPQAAARSLSALGVAAAGTGALMPRVVDAVRARATVGEISDTLRQAWGVYRP